MKDEKLVARMKSWQSLQQKSDSLVTGIAGRKSG